MKEKYIYHYFGILLLAALAMVSCENRKIPVSSNPEEVIAVPSTVIVEAENFTQSAKPVDMLISDSGNVYIIANSDGWIAVNVNIPLAGRYQTQIRLSSESADGVTCWVEDYYDNKNDRTYNITGDLSIPKPSPAFSTLSKDGSPLNAGLHKMKIHFNNPVTIDWVKFLLIKNHEHSPQTMTQSTAGSRWNVVWSDEFNGDVVDTSKWTYDIGNWGWGNGENQYYTEARTENARIENGNLIIEARRNDMGQEWTSARLTTRGKVSFLYGKIEFRAKVPAYKGNWSAGWTLGDEYVDELSWPNCGEIDILESVGYEMDDETGNGIAHASAHSGAYYFKLGNQPTGVIEVKNMNNEFHTYTVEWTPDEIKAYVDDILYFTYDDTSTDLSWPFSKPQNIILNLAMGGGWGGYYGIEESVDSQKMIIDYVRVSELR